MEDVTDVAGVRILESTYEFEANLLEILRKIRKIPTLKIRDDCLYEVSLCPVLCRVSINETLN